jgi:sterol 3beta-glucosyltransferase
MRIALLTTGTRGDVQPYVALGKGLAARGHEVVLAAPDDFASWIEGHGLAFHPMGIDMQDFLQRPEARSFMNGNVFALIKFMREDFSTIIRKNLDATWEAAREAEVIVFHPKAGGAVDVAEATGATAICAAPLPLFPTSAFPFILLPGNYGPWLNRLTYKPMVLSRAVMSPLTNRWRRETMDLGKGPRFLPVSGSRDGSGQSLCAVSPSVLTYPMGGPEVVHTTGYWFLDEGQDWQPDSDLKAFLRAGEPPVYIGFGSMATNDPAKLTREIVRGVHMAGVRAILATGWGGMDQIQVPDRLHVIKGAPHDALFKHVSAVVHHGGAGTVGAGLRAGKPTFICPLAFDQPFWGRRIFALGLGPKPQKLKRLKAERFAQGLLDLVRNESYAARAAEMGAAIAREDGVAKAIEVIEGL